MGSVLIVAAAGTGERLGRPEPKALVPLYGRPMICWCLDTFGELSFDAVIVAAPADRIADFEALVRGRGEVVAGGVTRAESVRRAFDRAGALPRDIVCIHDAARPLVTAKEVAATIAAAEQVGAAIAATPIVDTVKRVAGERIVATRRPQRPLGRGHPAGLPGGPAAPGSGFRARGDRRSLPVRGSRYPGRRGACLALRL